MTRLHDLVYMYQNGFVKILFTFQTFSFLSLLYHLVPLLNAKYTRNDTLELLFGSGDNPSPLFEIVEQELAWRAEGEVQVFIDGNRDISALRNVLKVSKI